MKFTRGAALLVGAVTLSAPVVAVGGAGSAGAASGPLKAASLPAAELALVAYSTPQAAYEAIEASVHQDPGRQGREVQPVLRAPSGDQSPRAVDGGQPADLRGVLAQDRHDPAGGRAARSAADWNANQYKGMVTKSVVVFVVRKGNPKGIKTWDDADQGRRRGGDANPFWVREYSAVEHHGGLRRPDRESRGRSPAEKGRNEYLRDKLFKNVVVQGTTSGRKALGNLHLGQGRRPACRMRTRRSSPSRTARGHRLRRSPEPDDPDREPGGDHDGLEEHPTVAKAVARLRLHARGPRRSSPTTATARSSGATASSPTSRTRRRAACSPSTTSVAGPMWPRSSSTPRPGSSP